MKFGMPQNIYTPVTGALAQTSDGMCANRLSLAPTVKIWALKRVYMMSFQGLIAGLLEIWITPDELYGAISCFLFQVFVYILKQFQIYFSCVEKAATLL